MTQQMTDPFTWNDEEYVFSGADDIYSLFDPEAFRFHPDMISTACYKDFIISFGVRDDRLLIDQLDIYCQDGIYPTIIRAEAKDAGK